VSGYLRSYKKSGRELAGFLIKEIARRRHIPSTAGIGTNLYLAKVALDITAKKAKDHMGVLDERSYIETLWDHRPITDFWQVARGTAARLAKYGIWDMGGVARAPEELMYRLFGINAELLIDHAWGREPCTIADIKAYVPKSRSVSSSQILFSDYSYDKALLVLLEMALGGCQELMRRRLSAGSLSIFVGYSKDVLPSTGASSRLRLSSNVYSVIKPQVEALFLSTVNKGVPIRRLGISFGSLVSEGAEGYDLFTDRAALEKERHLERTVLDIKDRFGKNAILRGFDLEEGATAVIRNKLIGGHNGG
jgi:DNA polymerase V